MTEAPAPTTTPVDAPRVPAREPAREPATAVPHGRGRWRARLVRILAVAGLVSVAAGTAVALHDASTPVASGGGVVGAPSFTVEYVDAPATEYVAYDHGASAGYRIELSNDGPLPVTVEDVPIAPMQEELRLLHPTEVLVEEAGDLAPFAPFRLGAGETRTVVVSGVFHNCEYYTERAMDLVVTQPVTWSVAGVSTTTDVALTHQLAIRSTFIRECPGRVMDRGARTRTNR